MKCRASITGWKRAAVTAVVAYALVLQALLLSFGGALHASAAQDIQAIVCAERSADGQDHHQSGTPHNALCCTLSCHGSAPAGPVPALAPFGQLTPMAVAVEPTSETPHLRVATHVLPLGSRAPPHFG